MLRVNLPLYWKSIANSQRRDPKYGMNSVLGDHFMKGHNLVFLIRLFFRVRSGNSIISPLFLLLMTKRCRNWVRGNEMISSGRPGAGICWIQVLNFRSHLFLCGYYWLHIVSSYDIEVLCRHRIGRHVQNPTVESITVSSWWRIPFQDCEKKSQQTLFWSLGGL